MTNFEYIKTLDIYEISEIFTGGCTYCVHDNSTCKDDYTVTCNEGFKLWLNLEYGGQINE